MKTTHAFNIMKPNVRSELQKKFGSDVSVMVSVLEMMFMFLQIFRSYIPLGKDDTRINDLKKIREFFNLWRYENQQAVRQQKNIPRNQSTKPNSNLLYDIDQTCLALINLHQEGKKHFIH